ncbi:MAG: HAD-IB family phosphatase [candidate division NC10 bacterium]|nr:HAD-IB family phosphatase [candidate division NC10 bacterium]MDE2322688.1 HAD-IB family phosphatase [candidate division NC10 bacterium]
MNQLCVSETIYSNFRLGNHTLSPRRTGLSRDLLALQVLCDFDGTITKVDATDAVLETFALSAFREWEGRWERGEITSRECLSRQVELIRADRAELVQFAAELPVDEGIVTLNQRCIERGIPLMIVSDGLDLIIETVLQQHGLSHIPAISNRLVWNGNGYPSLSFPFASPGCWVGAGTCKCAAAASGGLSLKDTAYIGDGRSDRCVSTVAQQVFAKGRLREWCDLQGIACEPFETLTDVTERLFRKGEQIE